MHPCQVVPYLFQPECSLVISPGHEQSNHLTKDNHTKGDCFGRSSGSRKRLADEVREAFAVHSSVIREARQCFARIH